MAFNHNALIETYHSLFLTKVKKDGKIRKERGELVKMWKRESIGREGGGKKGMGKEEEGEERVEERRWFLGEEGEPTRREKREVLRVRS